MTDDAHPDSPLPDSPLPDSPQPASPVPVGGRRQTHPVRGVIWGLLLGLGLALVAIVTRTVVLGWIPVVLLVVVGTAVGLAWGLFGPAKAAKLEA